MNSEKQAVFIEAFFYINGKQHRDWVNDFSVLMTVDESLEFGMKLVR
jgi:hypothetical protein